MKLLITLLLILTLNTYAMFTIVASANETAMHDSEGASTLDSTEVSGEVDEAEMAKKLANPLAAMISLPMQLNYDQDFGVDDTGNRFLMNVQPVVPIPISENWNLISRTILPVITQDELAAGTGRQTGLGDTSETLWFSPVKPTDKGLIWGVGPGLHRVPVAPEPAGYTGFRSFQNRPWTPE